LITAIQTSHLSARELHGVQWYIDHAPERRVTLLWCQQTESRALLPDCLNAQRASWADLAAPKSVTNLTDMTKTEYWLQPGKRVSLLSMIAMCNGGVQWVRSYCNAANSAASKVR
jgi:hypothetical protein